MSQFWPLAGLNRQPVFIHHTWFYLCVISPTRFGFDYYQSLQAMMFAVEEINARPDLLPNVTLGFQIFDTCAAMRRSVEGTLWMLSSGNKSIPNYQWQDKALLAGIVGDSGSTRSMQMISYFATSPVLSNRNQFPSFFRTIPSDEFQSLGLAQLVKHFGWSWVGLLATDDDYGQLGIQVIKQEISASGACVAFVETIVINLPNRNAPHVAKVIKESTANVVVVFSSAFNFMPVVEELLRLNVSGKIWVASESWSTSALLSNKRFKEILVGTIGFAIHSEKMPGFAEFMDSLHPSKCSNDTSVKGFWEQLDPCILCGKENNETTQDCTSRVKIEGYVSKLDLRLSFNVYTGVYTFARALQKCANVSSFQPSQINENMNIFFNDKGDPPAVYDIVNWKLGASETSPTKKMEETLKPVQFSASQVPYSKCNPSCPSGFQKVTIPGKPTCCYKCDPCPYGEISNHTDAVECHQCSWDMWPNDKQDACLPRSIEYLSYDDPMGASLAAIALLSSLVPVCILGIFFYHRTTPIVRANNWTLSCLLLVSLSFCFLCALTFIGFPRPEMCLLCQVAFGIVFALCVSCVLAKTITVVIAFKATKPGSRLRKWSTIKVSYSVMGFCVLVQICVCVMWLLLTPPFPEYDNQMQSGFIIIICNEGSSKVFFWIMLGYLGLLATISFIFAFLVRQLPDSFNEAKFITFSMLAFLSVWVSFVPAYLSARGKNTVALEIFAILSSSWALVICIFFPKCFIIIFRPDKNSREHVMKKDKGKPNSKFGK
uniref:G-protein coupled receptors family 3 profile domain-containing protein n=1 Tax=Leptobrachium leishanense TaxID=445787 RepID=A0A8C5MEH6_9ANUR